MEMDIDIDGGGGGVTFNAASTHTVIMDREGYIKGGVGWGGGLAN